MGAVTIWSGRSGGEGWSVTRGTSHGVWWRARSARSRAPCAVGQAPARGSAAGPPMVIDTGAFTPFVENMDRSLAFYHDVFGMEVPPMPDVGRAALQQPEPAPVRVLRHHGRQGAPPVGARARHPHRRRADGDPARRRSRRSTCASRIPATPRSCSSVRDVDATLARVKTGRLPGGHRRRERPSRSPTARARWSSATWTIGSSRSGSRPAMPANRAPADNIVDIRAAITVADLDRRTTQVYRDVLGFTVEGETAFCRRQGGAGTDRPAARRKSRRAGARRATRSMWFEFVEFKGVDRTPLTMRIQDRGATRVQFRTQNIDALVDVAEERRPERRLARRRGGADSAGLPGRARRRPQQLLRLALRAVRRLRSPRSCQPRPRRRPRRRPRQRPRRHRPRAHRFSSRRTGASRRSPASAPTRTSASCRAW